MKRAAVCISGQPRTWEACCSSWKDFLSQYDVVDFFCHLWDYNNLPYHDRDILGDFTESPVSIEEKQRFINAVKPKKIIFDSKRHFDIPRDGVSKPIMPFESVRSQYYSLWRAAQLKRAYEIENDFEYDVVFRIRPDVYFPKSAVIIPETSPSTIYFLKFQNKSEVFGTHPEQQVFTDQFFLADSLTFDTFSQLYYDMSYIDEDDIFFPRYGRPNPVTPEWIIGYYATHLNISVCPLKSILFTVKRGKEYSDRYRGKLKSGESA